MKLSLLAVVPVVLGLSFSNVAQADEPPAQPEPTSEVKSKPMIVVGGVMLGIGAATVAAGSALLAQSAADGCGDEALCDIDNSMNDFIGTALVIAGGIHTAVGIPLVAVGAQSHKEAEAPRASLELGLTSATFSLSF